MKNFLQSLSKPTVLIGSLLVTNGALLALFLTSFQQKTLTKELETETLVIRNAKNKSSIELSCKTLYPTFTINDNEGRSRLQILCKEDGTALLEIISNENKSSLVIESRQKPSLFLKNSAGKTISSWTQLKDGGSGIGLADKTGSAATLLKGGDTPSVAFFSHRADPSASLGISGDVSHLLISGNAGNDGVLIHGGHSSGMMVLDETGSLKILISKKGVFQGKAEEESGTETPKFFSDERDHDSLFPDQATKVR